MKKSPKKEIYHSLNNALASFCLSADLLSRQIYGKLTTQQKTCVASMLSDAKKIKNLVKKLPEH